MQIVHAGFPRDIGERAVPVVVIEHVSSEVRHVQIEETVVVVIAGGNSHAIADMADAGLFRDIHEFQLTGLRQQVPVQAIAGLPTARRRIEQFAVAVKPCALDQIDVESAVVIVIEQGHARAHDLGHVVAAGGEIEVAEVESEPAATSRKIAGSSNAARPAHKGRPRPVLPKDRGGKKCSLRGLERLSGRALCSPAGPAGYAPRAEERAFWRYSMARNRSPNRA